MITTSETKDKQCLKEYLPTLVQAYNCTKINAMEFSPYYLMYKQETKTPN